MLKLTKPAIFDHIQNILKIADTKQALYIFERLVFYSLYVHPQKMSSYFVPENRFYFPLSPHNISFADFPYNGH